MKAYRSAYRDQMQTGTLPEKRIKNVNGGLCAR